MKTKFHFLQAFTFLVFWFWCTSSLPAAPFAYISNSGDGTVSVIDTAINAVVDTIPLPGKVGAFAILPVAVNQAGTKVYVGTCDGGRDNLCVIDTITKTVVKTPGVNVNGVGLAVNPAGTRVYAGGNDGVTVGIVVIDTSSNSVVTTIPVVGGSVSGVDVNPSGTRIYAATHDQFIQRLTIINATTNSVVATIPLVGQALGVAVNSQDTKVYVADQTGLRVIDTATQAVVNTIPVGLGPHGVAVNPQGTRAYIALGHSVKVVDTTSNSVVTDVPVGGAAWGVAVTPDGTRVYVGNPSGNTVSVIDTATNAVIATIPVGTSPLVFGKFIGPAPPLTERPVSPKGLTGKWGIVNPLAEFNILLNWLHPAAETVRAYNVYAKRFRLGPDIKCDSVHTPLFDFCLPQVSLGEQEWVKIASVQGGSQQLVILKNIVALLRDFGQLLDSSDGLNFSVTAENEIGESEKSNEFALWFKGNESFQLLDPPQEPIVFVPGWRGNEETWQIAADNLKTLFPRWKEGAVLIFDDLSESAKCKPTTECVNGAFYRVSFNDVGTLQQDESFDDVESLARRLSRYLDVVLALSGQTKAIVVAHSAGGVVGRACLQKKIEGCENKIKRLVTYGTPHNGHTLATPAEEVTALRSALLEVLQDEAARDLFLNEVSIDLPFFGRLLEQTINRSLDGLEQIIDDMLLGIVELIDAIPEFSELVQDLDPGSQLLKDLNENLALPSGVDYVSLVGKWSRLAGIIRRALERTGNTSASTDVGALESTDVFVQEFKQNLRNFRSGANILPPIVRDPFVHAVLPGRAPFAFTEGADYIGVLKGLGYPVLSITPNSPVSIAVVDPDGRFVAPNLTNIPGASYTLVGGVEIPKPKAGNYTIFLTRHPQARPDQVFTLEAEMGGQINTLVRNQRVQDIPSQGYAVAVLPSNVVVVNVNNLVTFAPINSTMRTTSNTSGCPAGFVGKFSFNARLTDKNNSPALSNLLVKVATLTNGNLLQNADGGPGGVGATVTIAKTGSFSDGVLSAGEFVDVPLSICLKQNKAFSFFVDVLGATQ